MAKLGSTGHDSCGYHVTIEKLTADEREKLEGCLRGGHRWMRITEGGKAEFVESYNPLPEPTDDPGMLPFWRTIRRDEEVAVTPNLATIADFGPHESASISIQHLCGYNYTPENYAGVAEKLQSYGFECLRSKRAPDGRYWEIWFLYSLSAAKEGLREAVSAGRASGSELQSALEFLCRDVSFGTLDVSVQRLCMVMSD